MVVETQIWCSPVFRTTTVVSNLMEYRTQGRHKGTHTHEVSPCVCVFRFWTGRKKGPGATRSRSTSTTSFLPGRSAPTRSQSCRPAHLLDGCSEPNFGNASHYTDAAARAPRRDRRNAHLAILGKRGMRHHHLWRSTWCFGLQPKPRRHLQADALSCTCSWYVHSTVAHLHNQSQSSSQVCAL